MKKTLNILLALIIAFFTLPFSGNTVLADEKTYDDIEDGEYDIVAKAWHADKDEESGAAPFINEDAVLSIQDGEAELTITVPNNPMAIIEGLQVEGVEPTIDETDDGKDMTYSLSELKSELNAQVQYNVPAINLEHDVPFRFILEGLDDLPVNEEEPETPDDPEGDNDKEFGDPITDADKTYEVKYITDSDSTNRQFDNPATLLIKDDKMYIQMSGTGGQFIKSLTVNEEEVTWLENDEEGNFVIQFELPGAPSDEIDFGMTISPPGMDDMHHIVPLSFETPADLEEPEDPAEDPAEDPEEDPEQNPSDEPKEEPKENPSEKPKQEQKQELKEEQNNEDALNPNKAYEIDYTIKHETEDKTSAADSFFEKPGILLEKDGVYYLQVKVTGSSMIDNLKTEYGPVLIVEEDEDTMVVQFKVHDDLSQANVLDMHITVPGMYSEDHSARLFLDESSMKEVNADDYELVAGSEENDNGPLVKGKKPAPTPGDDDDNNGNGGDNNGNDPKGNDDDTPEKPEFGDNDGNGTGSGNGDGKAQNPQTGDTSGLLLYTLLLIGSLIPLGFKLRHRFI